VTIKGPKFPPLEACRKWWGKKQKCSAMEIWPKEKLIEIQNNQSRLKFDLIW
jgi:hypothetical protein